MSLNNYTKIIHTSAFRLTVFLTGIFVLALIGILWLIEMYTAFSHDEGVTQSPLLEAEGFSFVLLLKGIEDFNTGIILESDPKEVGSVSYWVLSRDGEGNGSSDTPSWRIVPGESDVEKVKNSIDNFQTLIATGTPPRARILYSIMGEDSNDKIIQLKESGTGHEYFLWRLGGTYKISIILVFIASGVVGWYIVRRTLKGVEKVTQTATQISEGDYDSRVPILGKGEEIDRLAMTFNNMLERIQTLIREMREMTDNIAHDLRSPITRIRGIAETTLTTAKGSSDYELTIGSIIEESDRLLDMINMMLDISEAEAGISKLNKSEIDCSGLVKEACELFQPLADDKGIRVVTELGNNITIYADNKKLQRVVANLLDNAVKYSQSKGDIIISTYEEGNNVVITVKDSGIGITPEDLPHIFKRFYRCDSSRSRTGTGLGLSWSQAIIQSHGGNITVSSTPDEGSLFTITLPKR